MTREVKLENKFVGRMTSEFSLKTVKEDGRFSYQSKDYKIMKLGFNRNGKELIGPQL